MKKIFLMLFCLNLLSVSATECSQFIEKQQEALYNKKIKINVRKEFTQESYQTIGEQNFYGITYGYADMKLKDKRKCRVSYICLLDENYKPIWGTIIPAKKS